MGIVYILELYHHGIKDRHETNQDMSIVYFLELYHHGIKDRQETNQEIMRLWEHDLLLMRQT
jgi:hypothetical protein